MDESGATMEDKSSKITKQHHEKTLETDSLSAVAQKDSEER